MEKPGCWGIETTCLHAVHEKSAVSGTIVMWLCLWNRVAMLVRWHGSRAVMYNGLRILPRQGVTRNVEVAYHRAGQQLSDTTPPKRSRPAYRRSKLQCLRPPMILCLLRDRHGGGHLFQSQHLMPQTPSLLHDCCGVVLRSTREGCDTGGEVVGLRGEGQIVRNGPLYRTQYVRSPVFANASHDTLVISLDVTGDEGNSVSMR